MQSISEAIALIADGADPGVVMGELLRVGAGVLGEAYGTNPLAAGYGMGIDQDFSKWMMKKAGGAMAGWVPHTTTTQSGEKTTSYRRTMVDDKTGKKRTEHLPLFSKQERAIRIATIKNDPTIKQLRRSFRKNRRKHVRMGYELGKHVSVSPGFALGLGLVGVGAGALLAKRKIRKNAEKARLEQQRAMQAAQVMRSVRPMPYYYP